VVADINGDAKKLKTRFTLRLNLGCLSCYDIDEDAILFACLARTGRLLCIVFLSKTGGKSVPRLAIPQDRAVLRATFPVRVPSMHQTFMVITVDAVVVERLTCGSLFRVDR